MPLGPLIALPRVGHDIGTGGGETTRPVMTQMKHVIPLGVPEQPSPIHVDAHQWIGKEAPAEG